MPDFNAQKHGTTDSTELVVETIHATRTRFLNNMPDHPLSFPPDGSRNVVTMLALEIAAEDAAIEFHNLWMRHFDPDAD